MFVDYDGKSVGRHVRAVRGGQCEEFGNFIDNGDGTITDAKTGLMWQQDTSPFIRYSWEQALSFCENLILNNDGEWTNGTPNASGVKYDDWRLPKKNELQSIVDYNRYIPSIDPIFSYTMPSFYWSSTPGANSPLYAWVVYFYYGNVNGNFKSEKNAFARAVRGGQCGSLCPIEKLYGEHKDQTELLRYYRDNVLNQTSEGKELIKLYYQWSPVIVKAMEGDEELKEEIKEMIGGILPLLQDAIE